MQSTFSTKAFISTIWLALSLCIPSSAQTEKPNILFICIDDLVPTLGCYGDPIAITPNIDALANQGVTFLNHHCTWSVCGPSLASLTTGLTPEETGVIGFRAIRHPDRLHAVTTLPQHFRNNGYNTACSGKFHDFRTVGDTTGIFDTNDEAYGDGKDVDDPASWSIPFTDTPGGITPKDANGNKVAVDSSSSDYNDHGDYQILLKGKDILQNSLATSNKPFFLAVGFKKPHLPFVAPSDMWAKYIRNDFPLPSATSPPSGASSELASAFSNNNEILGYEPYASDNSLLNNPANQRELIHGYYACTSWVDYLVGDLIDQLETLDDPVQESSPGVKKKLSETTIIVLWGDHGFHLGDHGRWAKHNNMDRATLCPLIIFDPRSTASAAKTKTPVNTLDIYPTLCELAGLPIPSQPIDKNTPTGRPLKGRSLVPILENPIGTSVNTGSLNLISKDGAYGYSYRTERFRYIEWINSSGSVVGTDLFDYQNDPGETKSVIADPAYAAIVHQLSRSMRAEPGWRGPDYDGNTNRLHSATPTTTGANAFIPFLKLEPTNTSDLTLSWPSAAGVTYDIVSNTTLDALTWPTYTQNVAGSNHTFNDPATKRFFKLGFGTNTPPYWHQDPVTKPNATATTPYTGQTLTTSTTDPNPSDSLTFAKINGPSWLTVSSTGDLSGTPALADIGANYFTVSVADQHGATVQARLQITVTTNTTPTTTLFPKTDATFAESRFPDAVQGESEFIILRHSSSNFSRVGYLKFNITGVGTVTSAKLHFRIRDEPDTIEILPSSNSLSGTSTPWTGNNLTWNNRPITGTKISSTSGAADEWVSIDVTTSVTGNGTYSFALDEQGDSRGFIYAQGTNAPYLEVTWE